jgi:hypothetical protein
MELSERLIKTLRDIDDGANPNEIDLKAAEQLCIMKLLEADRGTNYRITAKGREVLKRWSGQAAILTAMPSYWMISPWAVGAQVNNEKSGHAGGRPFTSHGGVGSGGPQAAALCFLALRQLCQMILRPLLTVTSSALPTRSTECRGLLEGTH